MADTTKTPTDAREKRDRRDALPEAPANPAERSLWREATVRLVKRAAPTKRTREDGTEEGPTAEELERAANAEPEIEIAISSESAVERYDWWENKSYLEVLSHEPGDVDLSYARDGLPLLVGHDTREMVGLVVDVRVDDDKMMRGRVRFSRAARAQEIKQDFLDGIRTKISVGYDYPAESYTEKAEKGQVTRRYTGWRPLEASSVPIPADYSVGVGRSARPGAPRPEALPGVQASKAKENTVETTATPAPEAGTSARAAVSGDHKEIAALAKQHKMEAKLADWIGNGASLDTVRAEIMEHYRAKSEQVVAAGGMGKVLDLSEREERQFSFARAIQNSLNGVRGFEHEVSEELYKKTGRKRTNPQAIMVPTQLLGRDVAAAGQRMEVATSGAGQQLKFTDYGGFLGLLRPRMLTGKLGVTTLSGLQGDLAFVTQTSASTFQWGAETANPTAAAFGTGLRTMQPHAGSGKNKYTRQLLAQSVESIEALVQDDLMKICAIGLDKAVIQGSGSNSQPTGITNTTGVGAVTMGTAGAVPTFPKLVDMWTEIATDDADVAGMAYLTTPGIAGYLQQTQQFSGTNGVPIWTWTTEPGVGQINGHRAFATSQVPSNLTKGSNTGTNHAIIFGDWPSVIVGEWGGLELLVDPYSEGPAYINVSAYLLADVFLRYVTKFAVMLDARTS